MRITQYRTVLTEDKKVTLDKEKSKNCPQIDKVVNSPDRVLQVARDFLRMHEDTEEHAYMLCLNTKCVLTSVFQISHGTVNSAMMSPREIFQKALLANAVCIIVLHNHPSGECTPSIEDIKVTERLVKAGEMIGIQVMDHVIIGGGSTNYYSLKANGRM